MPNIVLKSENTLSFSEIHDQILNMYFTQRMPAATFDVPGAKFAR